tara:strand:+ start:1058 stop:1759 length:702 start_codon:yes stop_codon:yes gene_type:complete
MLLINCDLGERGSANKIDDQLLEHINIANIACGGHAGNKESVDYYTDLCTKYKIKITAHISYPDTENFGRKVMQISDIDLLKSFDKQFSLFDDVRAIKPHGALYNELRVNTKLSRLFINWCRSNDIQELVLSPNGIVTDHAKENDIRVITESFIERGYMLNEDNTPVLIPRGEPNAEIRDVSKALEQYIELNNNWISINGKAIDFSSQTACIHSDSDIALELVKAITKQQGLV